MPGSEIKVTPDSESPIIPNATTIQGEDLFHRKYPKFPVFLEVYHPIRRSRVKYPKIHPIISDGDI